MAYRKFLTTLIFTFCCAGTNSYADYINLNSVLIGDRAAGMGGAFTALTGDPSASPFYNPATLARLDGSSLSTSVNLFNKYDVTYGNQSDLDESLFRINKGSIRTIPSASGIFTSFRNFTIGLSILLPQYQDFGGNIFSRGDESTFLRMDTESLWVGGAFAFNPDEKSAIGFSFYYTSDSTNRSLTDRYDDGGDAIVFTEEKTLSTNSFIAIIGYYYELLPSVSLGVSYRFKNVPVNGEGSYLANQVGTISGSQPTITDNKITGKTKIPDRLALGSAFRFGGDTLSVDVVYSGPNSYTDMEDYGDRIIHEETINYHIGYEHELLPWLKARVGLFTDSSTAPEIPANATRRYSDHIDKFGFSANLGIQTTEHTNVTLGGYYIGGNGYAAEQIGGEFQRIKKEDRVFSFLVATSYQF